MMQRSIIYKGFIKYNKTNDVTLMKTHMECAYLNLFA
jgi:hypothetical protein